MKQNAVEVFGKHALNYLIPKMAKLKSCLFAKKNYQSFFGQNLKVPLPTTFMK